MPARIGLNRRLTVQLEDAARLEPQVFDWTEKSLASVPVKAILLMLTEVVPELVSVTVFAPLVFPTATAPQVRDVGDGTTLPVPPALPVPESDTDRVVEPLVIVHVALSEPVVLGLKTIAAVQVADAARLAPQFVL